MAPPKTSQFTTTSKDYLSEAYTPMAGGLSLEERQELLYQAAQGFKGGREALESWSRKDLLQLICLEMGKERKYTGVSKSKMVELLLKLVSMKGLGEGRGSGSGSQGCGIESSTLQFAMQSAYRRQRKVGRPARVPSNLHTSLVDGNDKKADISWVCKNTACKAHLPQGTSFCQRCSCCICKKFDDNKDPSLWIVCTPEPLNTKTDCRLSCHIECALSALMAGVVVEASKVLLDGSYRCLSCGKISSLIGCWKKQLLIAKDARRVDTLCQRLSLSYRLLNGTVKHMEVHELVVKAVQTLEAEVGSITEGSAKFARGLVNRLSSSGDVLDLVNLALEKADALHEELVVDGQSVLGETLATKEVKAAELLCAIVFDKITSSTISLTVKGGGENVTGYRLWHRKACDPSFPNNPTCIIATNPGEAQILGLRACTEYAIYVVPFFERGIGEPAEARCFTRSVELPPPKEASQCEAGHPDKELNAEKDSRIPDKLESNFKVRELGKVLHSAWAEEYQSNHTRTGIFHGKGRLDCLINRKEEKKKNDCPSLGVNASSSPGAGGSHVGNGGVGSKPSPEKAPSSDFNVSANVDLGGEESRVTVEVELPPAPVRTLSRRDSSIVLQEAQVKGGQHPCAGVTDLDDASDNPGNSQTSQREETEAISQVVSDAIQANVAKHGVSNGVQRMAGGLKAKGHGESWAMQVHAVGTTIGMEPQTTIVRKRTSEGLGRGDGYGLVNGCGASVGGVLCATRNFELCVKIVRWLECEGYLKEDFRMKFLTWFSLKASEHEKRVVSVFIDTLQDNPSSLAAQLVDTFSDVISAKRHQMIANGFVNKLWR